MCTQSGYRVKIHTYTEYRKHAKKQQFRFDTSKHDTGKCKNNGKATE